MDNRVGAKEDRNDPGKGGRRILLVLIDMLAPLIGVLIPFGCDRRSSLRSDAPATFWQPFWLPGR